MTSLPLPSSGGRPEGDSTPKSLFDLFSKHWTNFKKEASTFTNEVVAPLVTIVLAIPQVRNAVFIDSQKGELDLVEAKFDILKEYRNLYRKMNTAKTRKEREICENDLKFYERSHPKIDFKEE